jgi:tol-pal system protein YbgF
LSVVPAPSASPSLDQRIKRVEQQVSNLQGTESIARSEALQKEVQTLRGQVEQLTHQLKQQQEQQKSMYTDLDKRLSQKTVTASSDMPPAKEKEAAKPAAKMLLADNTNQTKTIAPKKAAKAADQTEANAATASDSQPDVAEEQQIYQTAYNLIKAKKYEQAVAALQKMLQKYPSGQFASNAHYWLGELYGLMGKHDQALTEFNTVITNYPDSPRISDAQLKMGLIYAAKLNWPEAKSTFKKIVNRYPGTASARLALEQLRQIKQAGH